MRRKILVVLLAVLSVFACAFGLTACGLFGGGGGGEKDEDNEHGQDGHTHEYAEWVITKEATCTEDGLRERTCTVCDYTQKETIAKTDHKFGTDNVCKTCGYELEFTTGLAYGEYTRDNKTYYMVTGMGTATDKDLVIPAYHAGQAVTKIAESAFSGKDAIKSVYISNGIEEIGAKAFEYCTSLTKAVLPKSLNNYVYEYKKVDNSISLRQVTIPNIGENAFYGCQKLADISLPDEGILIGANAFNSTAYYNNAKNWNNGVLFIGNHLIVANDSFTSKIYTVGKDTVSVADKAFSGKKSLTEFTIPSNGAIRTSKFGENALLNCGITKADVPYVYLSYLPNKASITDLTVNGGTVYSLSEYTNVKNLVINGEWEYRSYGGKLKGLGKLENLTVKPYFSRLGVLFGKEEYAGSVAVEQQEIINGNSTVANYTYYIPENLKSVTVLSSEVSYGAFYNCKNLTSIALGSEVTKINNYSFYGCTGLKSITIPDSVTWIGANAFDNCSSLTTINVSENNENYKSIDGNLYSKDGKTLIRYAIGKENKSFVIPDSVTGIDSYAFYNCGALESITIPDSVTSIGKNAFYGTAYYNEKNNWENNVLYIGKHLIKTKFSINGAYQIKQGTLTIADNAFEKCSALTSVIIPDSVTSIGDSAFSECSKLESVTMGNGVTSIGKEAFYECSALTSITIPESVTIIGECAFRYCGSLKSVYITDIAKWCQIKFADGYSNPLYHELNLYLNNELVTDLVIPDSVTSIGDYAFYYCSALTSVTIPDSITSIGYYAFYGCSSLKSVAIPDSVTSIEGDAFGCCSSLESITIPDSVTRIGWRAFHGCDGLTSIIIPDSVTWIGTEAFMGCISLTIYCENSEKPSGWDSKWNYSNCPVIWDCKNNDEDNDGFAYTVVDGVRYSLKDGEATVIEQPSNITTANIPASVTYKNASYAVTSIGDNAFYYCSSLTSVTIPDSVTSIGSHAFEWCRSLTSITIPESVTSISDRAFVDCHALTIYCESAEKPSGWDSKWNYSNCPVIWDCKNNDKDKDGYEYAIIDGLRYLLKDGIATVIKQPRNITTANIPASVTYKNASYAVTSIGGNAFKDCSSLINVTIPDGVTSIGGYAFDWCYSLTSITIPDSVTSIGGSAFNECSKLTSITYSGTKAQWDAIEKRSSWDFHTGKYTIHCTDGDI